MLHKPDISRVSDRFEDYHMYAYEICGRVIYLISQKHKTLAGTS